MPTKRKNTAPRPPARLTIPKDFSPRMLARSVIAIPLLEEMKTERDYIKDYRDKHRELTKDRTGAIFYRPDFDGGPAAAWRATIKLLKEAEERARKDFAQMPSGGPPVGPQAIEKPSR